MSTGFGTGWETLVGAPFVFDYEALELTFLGGHGVQSFVVEFSQLFDVYGASILGENDWFLKKIIIIRFAVCSFCCSCLTLSVLW